MATAEEQRAALIELRDKHGLKPEAIAEGSGASGNTLRNFIRGNNQSLHDLTKNKVAQFLVDKYPDKARLFDPTIGSFNEVERKVDSGLPSGAYQADPEGEDFVRQYTFDKLLGDLREEIGVLKYQMRELSEKLEMHERNHPTMGRKRKQGQM